MKICLKFEFQKAWRPHSKLLLYKTAFRKEKKIGKKSVWDSYYIYSSLQNILASMHGTFMHFLSKKSIMDVCKTFWTLAKLEKNL